jgi:echinoderm microtubule-associated protein-like 6
MANPTWKKTAELMTPLDHHANPSKPASTLELDWVHGYRGFDCRNNVRYVGNAIIAFSAAALGVVQTVEEDQSLSEQRYFGDHTDDVVSISVGEPQMVDGVLSWANVTIATGEMGKRPAIYVWKADQMLSLACMRGSHTKAVAQLAHSQNGEELFSVGLDYTVAVYSLKQGKSFGKQLCSAQGPKGKILHACAVGKNFVTCGEKHICFWVREGSAVKMINAKLAKHANKMYMSATQVKRHRGVVVGAADGTMLVFDDKGGSLVKLSSPPSLPFPCINSLWGSPGGERFILGGKDGSIWKIDLDNSMTSIASHHILKVPAGHLLARNSPIRSACLSMDGEKLLVGTQNCDIIETDIDLHTFEAKAFGRPLNNGHFKDELWGLAVRPPLVNPPRGYLGQYATVGDDKVMRIFDVRDRVQVKQLDMGTMARCCAYSPDGDMLAVGFGGRVGRGKAQGDGMFRVYRLNYQKDGVHFRENKWYSMIHEARDAKQWITDIKFSADCRMLVVGSKDNSVYVYSIAQQFKLKFKFSKHNSYITHFDISEDGKHLQTNCGAYELLFCNLDTGKPILKGSSLSLTKWATQTCTLGWQVQGIWPSGADGTDVNSVDRSPTGDLLATADDFGKVKVFRFPAVHENSEFNVYSGHSSHVTNARWISGRSEEDGRITDAYLITLGGNDKCVFQWKNRTSEEEDSPRTSRRTLRETDDAFRVTDLAEPSGGDEFMAVKPWKGAIKSPSHFGSPDKTRVVQFFAALGKSHCNANVP